MKEQEWSNASGGQLTVGDMIDLLANHIGKDLEGRDMPVFFRKIPPIVGNISEAVNLNVTTYGFFGLSLPCVIIETYGNEEE